MTAAKEVGMGNPTGETTATRTKPEAILMIKDLECQWGFDGGF
jgi:hypothetical protein